MRDFSAYPQWHDVPLEYWEAWNRIFGASQEGLDLAAPCPVCAVPALRQWYMVGRLQETVLRGQRFIARGSVWTWCSHCHTYAHYSGLVPEWWSSDLDVNTDTVGHQPTAIEEARLAREYRTPGAADAAEKDARSLPAGDERTKRFTELAMALATAGDRQRAAALARSLDRPSAKALTLCGVATRLMRQGEMALATGLLREAEAVAHTIEASCHRAAALDQLAQTYRMMEARDEAVRIWTHAIAVALFGENHAAAEEDRRCSRVVRDSARGLALLGEIATARGIARAIQNKQEREQALNDIGRVVRERRHGSASGITPAE